LVSGDPLFFGLGRLLLEELPREQLTFHPYVSAVQLAFHRIKIPWQDARIISAHGRSLDELIQALQQGVEKIAVLTDGTNTPSAIARLFLALDLSSRYEFWVCENLGGSDERVQRIAVEALLEERFAPLNVVVLLRQSDSADQPLDVESLPLLGLPDERFASFSDRPGLMTKREVRILILGELALQPEQIVWDIGAGTGSVSIEIGRLSETSRVYAIEKTAIGSSLIEQNCRRLQVKNVVSIHGTAPDILQQLPEPNRIFIGGSGGNLNSILDTCHACLAPNGIVVLALATLEHLNKALDWLNSYRWEYRLLQVQLSRSVPVGQLTRFTPLNPVTILTATRSV
jgi:precorrin-6Y C5,15-methyltransferase (decarboxylating)